MPELVAPVSKTHCQKCGTTADKVLRNNREVSPADGWVIVTFFDRPVRSFNLCPECYSYAQMSFGFGVGV